MAAIDIMQDSSEIVPYANPGLPLYISLGRLSYFPNFKMLCHWHDDLELIAIKDGSMQYRVGEHTVSLSAGDILFVNTRQLHYGFSSTEEECHYYCVLCHPELLGANKVLYQQYLAPVLENPGRPYLHLTAGSEDTDALLEMIEQIYAEKEEGLPGYEMAALGRLHLLWRKLYPLCLTAAPGVRVYTDETLQKDMVSFIQKHYAERLTLSDIAAAGHVCQNRCCMIFRRYLQQSPIDFLNAYRLEVSCHLLKNTALSVTEVATVCGFNHLSYFSKLFLRKYGATPTEWRQKNENVRN